MCASRVSSTSERQTDMWIEEKEINGDANAQRVSVRSTTTSALGDVIVRDAPWMMRVGRGHVGERTQCTCETQCRRESSGG